MGLFDITQYTRERRRKLVTQGLCAQCGRKPNRENRLFCEDCAKKANARQKKRLDNPELLKRTRLETHDWRKRMRIQALLKIAHDNSLPLKCPCGCDILEILEINHKNGGGTAERKRSHSTFYSAIVKGQRSTSDLNILCKVCNAAHFAQKKTGRKWEISFQV